MKKSSLKTVAVHHSDGTPGVITYGYQYLEGNADAYFTVTAYFKGYDLKGNRQEFGGCCHDEILALMPSLKPLIDLHLAAVDDGWPMHLYANAEYHCGLGSKFSNFAPRHLAAHLRISDEAADDLANEPSLARLRAFIDSQLPRYAMEAQAAINLFNL